MSRVKQLALDVDVDFTASSPFSITFTSTTAVVFTSPTVTLRTRGGDIVTGTAVPAVAAADDELTCSWSTVASAAANTNTSTTAAKYRYEVQALVDGAGPFPIFGGDVTVWPKGAVTGPSSTTAVTGTVQVGGVEITGTVNLSGGGVSAGQIDGGSATSVYGGTTSIDGGTA